MLTKFFSLKLPIHPKSLNKPSNVQPTTDKLVDLYSKLQPEDDIARILKERSQQNRKLRFEKPKDMNTSWETRVAEPSTENPLPKGK